MIRESIVITTDLKNKPHVVPMGINYKIAARKHNLSAWDELETNAG